MNKIISPAYRNVVLTTVLLVLFFFEVSLHTFWNNIFGPYTSAIITAIIGLLIGCIPLIWVPKQVEISSSIIPPKIKMLGALLINLIGVSLCFMLIEEVIIKYPINFRQSDIIPQIQIMVQRLLLHKFPYSLINEWGYKLSPTYQPMQWLPFIIAQVAKFDYRWVATGVLMIAIVVGHIAAFRKVVNPLLYLVLSTFPFIIYALFFYHQDIVLVVTIETLIAGYYLLLAYSLSSNSPFLIGGAIILCLLSRYSLVLWLPLYFVIMLTQWDFKKSLYALGIVLLGVLVVYVLPFYLQDNNIFINGYNYYTAASLGEWKGFSTNDYLPTPLFSGHGVACFFYTYVNGPLAYRLQVLQLVHVLVSLLTVVLLGTIYFLRLTKKVPFRLFLLCNLKIYLMVFYTFIQVPYLYLMMVPLFISLPILSVYYQPWGKLKGELVLP